MKKKTIIISTVLALLVLVANLTVVVSSGMLKRQELSWDENPWEDFESIIERKDQEGKLQGMHEEVPIYLEEELLFKTDGLFFLNRDACFYDDTNWRPNDAGAIMAAYPTPAIRERSDKSVYTIYETDTGYRLYLMFDSSSDYATTTGFPVVIKDVLSYAEFSDLKVGDAIEKVEAIDSVATLHKKMIIDVWNLNPKGAAAHAEDGYPCTSIHYLKEGILKIEYEMLDDQSLIISDIVFNDEYILENAKGEIDNYMIFDEDLPL